MSIGRLANVSGKLFPVAIEFASRYRMHFCGYITCVILCEHGNYLFRLQLSGALCEVQGVCAHLAMRMSHHVIQALSMHRANLSRSAVPDRGF